MKNSHLLIGITLIVGAGFFILAITSTYTLIAVLKSKLDPFELIAVV